jgi:hypothetical protein
LKVYEVHATAFARKDHQSTSDILNVHVNKEGWTETNNPCLHVLLIERERGGNSLTNESEGSIRKSGH